MYVVEPVAAFDAKTALVRRSVTPLDELDPIIAYMIIKQATDATIRAR